MIEIYLRHIDEVTGEGTLFSSVPFSELDEALDYLQYAYIYDLESGNHAFSSSQVVILKDKAVVEAIYE